MKTERLHLLHAGEQELELLIEGPAAFEAAQGMRVIPGYLEFPEALPYSLDKVRNSPPEESIWWQPYLFVLVDENAVIGLGGYKGPPLDGVLELGYGVAPEYQGRGYATEAARALARHAHSLPFVHTVLAHTLAEPSASCRVLEKVGFVKTAEVLDEEDGLIWRWQYQP